MKRNVFGFIAMSAAVPAMAGSLSLDGRFDYSSKSYNDDANKSSHSTFMAKPLRLDYQGKLNDEIGFRARVRLDQQDANKTAKDSLSKAVDYGYISHKLSDYATVYYGKFGSEIGGFEGGTASADLYLTSEAYSGKSAIGTALISGTSDYLYLTGVKTAFKVGSYTLSAMVTDRVKSGAIAGCTAGDDISNCDYHEAKNTKFLVGMVAKGSHLEGALKTNISFYQEEKDKDTKRTFAALGLQFTAGDFQVTADYLANDYKQATVTDKVSSAILQASYLGLEEFVPALKVFSTSSEVASAKDTGTGVSAVLEYKPIKEANFRYHLAVNNHTTKGDSTGDLSLTMTEVVAGIRINADFLK